MRVWVTRAEPGAAATGAALRARGHDPLVAPLLTVQPMAKVRLDLDGVAALAFTSANAVDAFVALSRRRDLTVWCVGPATAAAARAAGLVVSGAGEGDAEALATLIAEAGAPGGLVLHPTAEAPAVDLAGSLARRGVPARAVAVYRTCPVEALPEAARAGLVAGTLEAVLLHSPRAARALADLLAAEPPDLAAGLHAFGLSPACFAPLRAACQGRLDAPPRPAETALLDMLAAPPSRAP